jgi:ribonuclease-3
MVRQGAIQHARPASELAASLGVTFKDPLNLEAALYHRSYLNEAPEDVESNERLEFLGDAVLGSSSQAVVP